MNQDKNKTGMKALGIGRIILGFLLTWAFLDKLLGLGMKTPPSMAVINGGSPTEYYLNNLTSGIFEPMWHTLAGNAVVDTLLMAGLILVGLGLMFGVASKLSTIGFIAMMILMFTLNLPPEDNPLFSHNILYLILCLAIYCFNGFRIYGLHDHWMEIPLVKNKPLLW